jgi:hypothetical protein
LKKIFIAFLFAFTLFVKAEGDRFDAASVNKVQVEGSAGDGRNHPSLEVGDRDILTAIILGTETDLSKLHHIDGEQRGKLENLISAGTIGANPTSVGSLVQWIRADMGTSLNGATVSAWADQSGSGYHYTQATADRQPELISSSINGKPAVRFDGTNDFMSCSTFALSQPYTLACVTQPRRNVGGMITWGGLNVYLYRPLSGWRIYGGTSQIDTVGAATINIWHIVLGVFNGASSSIYKNNAAAVTGSIGTDGFSGTTIGNYYTGADLYSEQCDIAEILVYSKALSAAEISTVKTYLNSRYAIY